MTGGAPALELGPVLGGQDAECSDDINTDQIVSVGLAPGEDFSLTGEPVLVPIPADLITAYGIGPRVLWTATPDSRASEPDRDPGCWIGRYS